MTVRSISDLPIDGLEQLFCPRGLPLVDKGAQQPTTSIAIFGDSGAGKTTLAVALSHAIARALGGTTLYLTTELAPTELAHKRDLLELDAFEIVRREHGAKASVGAFLTEHLALLESPAEGSVSRRALAAAWDLVRRGSEESAAVRSVVVDAFPLFASAHPSERDDVVALIQALESKGISVVIVQEAGGADYLPFVADLAFELRFENDPDTGELVRRLACRKSRYVHSLVGPHDTGLDSGKVAVWPDLLAVETTNELPRVQSPRMFFPLGKEGRLAPYREGALVLSTLRSGPQVVSALLRTPGVVAINVNCGPITRIVSQGESGGFMVPEWEGAHSIGWAVLKFRAKTDANTAVFTGISSLMDRPRSRVAFQRMLEALRMTGMLVCVHGTSEALRGLIPIADFSESAVRGSSLFPSRHHRSAAAWLALYQWPIVAERRCFAEQAASIVRLFDAGRPLHDLREGLRTLAEDAGSDPSRRAMIALALHAIGSDTLASKLLENLRNEAGVVWASALSGRQWLAARAAFEAVGSSEESKEFELLWAAFTAVYASSDPALERILASIEAVPAVLDFVLRTLAARERWSELDALIDQTASALDLPPYLTRRLHADSRLEGPRSSAWQEAADRLVALASDSSVPPAHRAIVLYNLGVARAKCGAVDAAREAWQQALAADGDLEISQELLESDAGLIVDVEAAKVTAGMSSESEIPERRSR